MNVVGIFRVNLLLALLVVLNAQLMTKENGRIQLNDVKKSYEGVTYDKKFINQSALPILIFTLPSEEKIKQLVLHHNGQSVTNASGTDVYFQRVDQQITVQFKKPTNNTIGIYVLSVTTANDQQQNITAYVFSGILLPPFEKSQLGLRGDRFEISCKPEGYPSATVILWRRLDGYPVRANFSVNNETLVFDKLEYDDAALYMCRAGNGLGVDEVHFRIRVKDRMAALWPFIGILIEVAILIAAILVYERKRSKAATEALASGQDNDPKVAGGGPCEVSKPLMHSGNPTWGEGAVVDGDVAAAPRTDAHSDDLRQRQPDV